MDEWVEGKAACWDEETHTRFRKHTWLQRQAWGSEPKHHHFPQKMAVLEENVEAGPLLAWGHLSPHHCHSACPACHLRTVRC